MKPKADDLKRTALKALLENPLFVEALVVARERFQPRRIHGQNALEALALQQAYLTGAHDALDYLKSLTAPPAAEPVKPPVEWGKLEYEHRTK